MSVASYIWTASPKNSEKLYSIAELVGGLVSVAPGDDHRRAVRGHADELVRVPPLSVKGLANQTLIVDVQARAGQRL
jgi:hypothetical protein